MKHWLPFVIALTVTQVRADPRAPTGVDLATVSRGLQPVPESPRIAATKTCIVVEVKALASIANGDVDPSEKEGGSTGIRITRIAEFMKTLAAASRRPLDGALVIVDQSLPYRLLVSIVFS